MEAPSVRSAPASSLAAPIDAPRPPAKGGEVSGLSGVTPSLGETTSELNASRWRPKGAQLHLVSGRGSQQQVRGCCNPYLRLRLRILLNVRRHAVDQRFASLHVSAEMQFTLAPSPHARSALDEN